MMSGHFLLLTSPETENDRNNRSCLHCEQASGATAATGIPGYPCCGDPAQDASLLLPGR